MNFIYRFYDAVVDLPFKKIQYYIIIIQNGKEIFRDENAIAGFAGSYRQWIFEESGPVIIKFENIKLSGSAVSQGLSDIATGSSAITLTENSVGRIGEFTAMVYTNPTKTTPVQIVQPEETAQFYYELPVIVVIIPTVLFFLVIFLIKRKPDIKSFDKKSTPI